MKRNFQGSLKAFYQKLRPGLRKPTIQEDLTGVYQELTAMIAPMYRQKFDFTYEGPRTSKFVRKLERELKKEWEGDIIATINKVNDIIHAQSEDVFDLVDSHFNTDIHRGNLDYRQMNILRYVQALHFYMEYGRNLIIALLKDENNSPNFSAVQETAMADFVFDEENQEMFIAAIKVLSIPVSDFEKKIESLQGHMFDPEVYEVQYATNGRKTDPYNFGIFPPDVNPIYLGALVVNGWRVNRHKRNKEELQALQLRLLAMEKERDGELSDEERAKLEKSYKYYMNLANRLSGKIERMEKEALD